MNTVLQGVSKTVKIGPDLPTVMIGERINPTGRKVFSAELQAGDLGRIARDADEQIKAGAAVLDVNVGGDLVYPLAEKLQAFGTPMLFLTGYDAKSIDQRFRNGGLLTKPIDESELAACLAGMFDRGPNAAASINTAPV